MDHPRTQDLHSSGLAPPSSSFRSAATSGTDASAIEHGLSAATAETKMRSIICSPPLSIVQLVSCGPLSVLTVTLGKFDGFAAVYKEWCTRSPDGVHDPFIATQVVVPPMYP